MTVTTHTTDREGWDIGKALRRHRAIVRAADAYAQGKITWNNFALLADQYGGVYADIARTLPGVRIGGNGGKGSHPIVI